MNAISDDSDAAQGLTRALAEQARPLPCCSDIPETSAPGRGNASWTTSAARWRARRDELVTILLAEMREQGGARLRPSWVMRDGCRLRRPRWSTARHRTHWISTT